MELKVYRVGSDGQQFSLLSQIYLISRGYDHFFARLFQECLYMKS